MTVKFTAEDDNGQAFLIEFDLNDSAVVDFNQIADEIIAIVGEKTSREERRS